ncbi:MAG: tRNA epoxyqueuosine(34) reductase QueG [Proteobacteria bacterium]|nr:MAG: tRNA epoxyqueuosine(34) reductase QueG [Pseudomonadota bacterium]
MTDFGEKILGICQAQGLEAFGLVDIDQTLDHPLFQTHYRYYADWISKGMHGEMKYLERGFERRGNPRLLLPSSQSVLSVLFSYPRKREDDGVSPRYARYLVGDDYHDRLKERLEQVAKSVSESTPGLEWKVCVDTSAMLERTWAMLSGLGWIGKNSLLIHPKLGSYVFIASILFSEKSGLGPNVLKDYCGNCTRCLKACPTGALIEPSVLDSRKCIAYWTLEMRGPWKYEEPRQSTKRWVAGCDGCQEVCPFNIKPARDLPDDPEVARLTQHCVTDLEYLERETELEYKARVKDTALSRVKFADFKRNLEWFKE